MAPSLPQAPSRGVRALVIEGFGGFTPAGPGPLAAERVSPALDPGFPWDELVVSWEPAPGMAQRVDLAVRLLDGDGPSGYYRLGSWSPEAIPFGQASAARTSVNGQADARARVDTDTLTALQPARRVALKLTAGPGPLPPERLLARVTLAFRDSRAARPGREANRLAWGLVLEPPRRAQGSYPHGPVICSPTSTSMVLGYWARTLGDPGLDREVPQVVEGVYDPAWKGTGNWAFNTAYAAALGLRAAVLRLADLRDLEDLVVAGIPPVCSVSYGLLKGKPAREPDDGHLVVLAGFTAAGDAVLNDPGIPLVRRTCPREAFLRAWAASGRTAYLIHPGSVARPALSVD